jgi:hypothetical protein
VILIVAIVKGQEREYSRSRWEITWDGEEEGGPRFPDFGSRAHRQTHDDAASVSRRDNRRPPSFALFYTRPPAFEHQLLSVYF